MRFGIAGVLALAACSGDASEATPEPAKDAERIACALGPGTGFSPSCTIERSRDSKGTHRMVVRHPDGGFRRFEVDADNVIVAADGADPATVAVSGDTAEVEAGDDRYRIPLKRREDAKQP